MTKVLFSEMSLTPKVERAVSLMGFDFATPVQSEAIPVIRTGVDVIARSQTGTGKNRRFRHTRNRKNRHARGEDHHTGAHSLPDP